MNRQQLVVVVCRDNIRPKDLQPLQLIIPTMQVTGPFSLYTSLGKEVKGNDLYQALAKALTIKGKCSLSITLQNVLDQRKSKGNQKTKKFRVCVIGGQDVDWDVVLTYKRHNILIDTAGTKDILSQVSHTTGGISKEINASNLIKTFLTDFSMASQTRKYFFMQKDSAVQFHMQPYCCPSKKLTSNFFVCSVCMTIYCNECCSQLGGYNKPSLTQCLKCHHKFDPELPPLEPELQTPLIDEKEKKKQIEEKIGLN